MHYKVNKKKGNSYEGGNKRKTHFLFISKVVSVKAYIPVAMLIARFETTNLMVKIMKQFKLNRNVINFIFPYSEPTHIIYISLLVSKRSYKIAPYLQLPFFDSCTPLHSFGPVFVEVNYTCIKGNI